MNILETKPILSNSLFVGKVAFHSTTIDSTNSAAIRLLSKSKPTEGTVICADHQTEGRGQIGSRWQSPEGANLLLSVIFYPKFLSVTQQHKLHQVVSLAICATLEPFLDFPEQLRVKWPNDVYYGDQKLGGILIENSLQGTYIRHTVIGIGLNINQVEFDPSLSRATSLRVATSQPQDRNALLGTLCQQLEQHYLALKQQHYQALEQAYRQRLYGYQTWRSFRRQPSGEPFRGKITGINNTGQLQVQTLQGIEVFAMKELSFEWE